MLEAVAGYYNGENIVLNEKVLWGSGQEVIVTVIPPKEKEFGTKRPRVLSLKEDEQEINSK